jgi:WD40 repeat protein
MFPWLATWLLLGRFTVAADEFAQGNTRSAPQQSRGIDAEEVRIDRYGDVLPAGVRARMGTVRLRPAGVASALAFSADSRTLYSTGFRGVFAWDVSTGRLRYKLAAPEDEVSALTLAAHDTLLAALCGEKVVRLWQPATAKPLGSLPAHSARALAISADGTTLAVGLLNHLVQVWDVPSRRQAWQLEPPSQHLFGMHFLDNSRGLLMVGRDSMAGRCVIVPDGNASTERAQPEWSKEAWAACVAWTHHGRLMATATSTQPPYAIQLWDAAMGRPLRLIPATRPEVTALGFAPDERALAVGCLDGSLRVLDTATGKESRRLQTQGHAIREVVFSPDGKLVAATCSNGAIQLWEAATGRGLLQFEGHQGPVDLVAYSPDGKTLATAGPLDAGICLWDSASGSLFRRLSANQAAVHCLTFSVDGKQVVSGDGNGCICFWEAGSGILLRTLTVPPHVLRRRGVYHVDALNLSADGRRLMTVAQDRFDSHAWGLTVIDVWDVATGKLSNRRVEQGSPHFWPASVQFAPEGQWVVLPDQEGLSVRESVTGKEIYRWRRRVSFETMTFSQQGSMLAIGRRELSEDQASGTPRFVVQFIEPATGRMLFHIEADVPVEGTAFCPDGSIFATANPDGITLWETATGLKLFRLPGSGMPIRGMSFAPDGSKLATGSGAGAALVWDLRPPTSQGKTARELTAKDLAVLWDDLGAGDGTRAYQVVWILAAAPPNQVCSFLQAVLHPATEQDRDHLQKLIANLDDNRFATRELASQELKRLGAEAEPALRQALANHPSAEVRRRIDSLLAEPVVVRLPEKIQRLRAIRVLERIGTPQARQLLKSLAEGAALAPETAAAKAACKRLASH